jgi:hypothetical protein
VEIVRHKPLANPLDRAQLERAVRVKFTLSDAKFKLSDAKFAELKELAEYCVWYCDPTALYCQIPLFAVDADRMQLPTRQWKQKVLMALVEGVEDVWRESGGHGPGTSWDNDPEINGGLVRLLRELFDQAVAPANRKNAPAGRTLRLRIGELYASDEYGEGGTPRPSPLAPPSPRPLVSACAAQLLKRCRLGDVQRCHALV